jgi:hypothetical protein
MASAATSLRTPAFRSWRQDRWPRSTQARWSLRLALAAPYVLFAELTSSLSGASAANVALERRAATLHWSFGLGWVSHFYPPIPLVLARILPDGPRSLAVLGALCTGVLVQLTAERLLLRSIPPATAALLTASIAVMPVFWFVATTDLSTFLTLCFLSVALTGLLDFTFNYSTESGFIAGIAFGLATMCDLAAFSYAVAGGLAAFVVPPSARSTWGLARRRAAATVVLFPSVAAVLGWSFLEWRFTGNWTRSFTIADPALLVFDHGVWGALRSALGSTVHDLAFTPLLVVAATLLLARRPPAFLAVAAVVVCVLVDSWLGIGVGSASTVLLLAAVSLVVLPERPNSHERLLLWSAAILQVAVGFVGLSIGLPVVAHWLFHLLGAVGY